jgi:hypothetical protein
VKAFARAGWALHRPLGSRVYPVKPGVAPPPARPGKAVSEPGLTKPITRWGSVAFSGFECAMGVSGRYTARVFAVPEANLTISGGWALPGDCDMPTAVEYAFRSTPEALRGEEPLGPCDDERHEVLVRRSSAVDRIRGLDWRLFDVCGVHLEQLIRLDDRATTAIHPSRLDLRTDRPYGRRPVPLYH